MALASYYNHKQSELQAQKRWEKADCFSVKKNSKAPKSLCLSLPPNLAGKFHLGHCRNHVICDVVARYKRMRGDNVLHAVGWDTFGLQLHLAAKSKGADPASWADASVDRARALLQRLGLSADWSRQVSTSDPAYYKWQQALFTRLWQHDGLIDPQRHEGVAYWDPGAKAYLSLRQLVNGRGPDSGMLIEVRKVSTYEINVSPKLADGLLEGLEKLSRWDSFVKNMQRESVGRESGLTITFPVHDKSGNAWPAVDVFTSRPDTLMGTTFIAVGVDHELARRVALANQEVEGFRVAVNEPTYAYQKMAEDKRQEGMPLGLYAVNPVNGDRVPVWVANFVVAGYGTNAVLGVPGHDQRNFNFAERHNLPVRRIEKDSDDDLAKPLLKPLTDKQAMLCNSGALEKPLNECKQELLEELESKQHNGKAAGMADSMAWRKRWDDKVNDCVITVLRDHDVQASPSDVTRLRNWKVSSQDYWGCPVPLVHCEKCGPVPVPEKDLPVVLPAYEDGKDSLSDYKNFIACSCPKCGKDARRDTDTFNNLMDTAWLHARLTCPELDSGAFDNSVKDWLPVDFYCSGVESATNHLLCARILHRLFRATGILPATCGDEPIDTLLSQGMVLNYGLPMATRYANAIEPDGLLDEFGADLLRLYLGASVDPRHPLHWDDHKLFALQGVLTGEDFLALRLGKLAGTKYERTREILTSGDITRLQKGLLDRSEIARLQNGKLAGKKLGAVGKLLEPHEIKRLQQGLLDHAELRLLRSNKLPATRMAKVKSLLEDIEINRLQHGILSPHELALLCAGRLPAKQLAVVEQNLPQKTLAKIRACDLDPNEPGAIAKLQQEHLDPLERAAAKERQADHKLLTQARKVLSDGDLTRLWNGLLDRKEYAALRAGKLAQSKLAKVRKLLSERELNRLLHGALDREDMALFRRGKLKGKKLAKARVAVGKKADLGQWQPKLAARKLAAAKNCLPDRRRLEQLRLGKLGAAKLAAVETVLSEDEIKAYQESIMDDSTFDRVAGFIDPERLDLLVNHLEPDTQRKLDRIMSAKEQARLKKLGQKRKSTRPLLRFLDRQRMDILLNHVEEGKMDALANFIEPDKMEHLLGFAGLLWHAVTQAKQMIKSGAKNTCKDERRIELHCVLQAINDSYGNEEQGFKLNRVVTRSRDLLRMLIAANNPDSDDDCALAAETCDIMLKVLHPLIPHVTEELWQLLEMPEVLAEASWPIVDKKLLMRRELIVNVQENGRHKLSFKAKSGTTRAKLEDKALQALKEAANNNGYPAFPKCNEKLARVEWAQLPGERALNFVVTQRK